MIVFHEGLASDPGATRVVGKAARSNPGCWLVSTSGGSAPSRSRAVCRANGAVGARAPAQRSSLDAAICRPLQPLGPTGPPRGQGQPSRWSAELVDLVAAALAQSPGDLGYPANSWTVPLLQALLAARWRSQHQCGWKPHTPN